MVLATGQQLPTTVSFDIGWLRGKAGYWWFGRSSPLIGLNAAGERKYVSALLWNANPNGSVTVETYHNVGRDQYPLGSLTWDEGQPLTEAMEAAGKMERDLLHTPDLALRQIALGLATRVVDISQEAIEAAKTAKAKHEEVKELAAKLGKEVVEERDYDAIIQQEYEGKDDAIAQMNRYDSEYKKRLDEWIVASKNALQLFACGCLWLQQKIVTASQAPLDRAAQRRLAREGIDPKCLVVELRSKQYTHTTPDEEAKHIDWAWQWAVRGHWRDQPTKEGTKLIWIHPYIKGPEDKPLKPDAGRVFAVTR